MALESLSDIPVAAIRLVRVFSEEAGHSAEAATLLEKCFSKYAVFGDAESALECGLERITLALNESKVVEATMWLRKARRIYNRQVHRSYRARLYSCSGRIAYVAGNRYVQAYRALLRAVKGHYKHGTRWQIIQSYVDCATAATDIGLHEECLDALGAALRILPSQEIEEQIRILGQAGVVYTRLAQFEQAHALLKHALLLAEENLPWISAMLPLRQLGVLYEKMDCLGEAEHCFVDSFRLALADGTPTQIIASLDNIASLALRTGQIKKAIHWLAQAIRIVRDTPGINVPLSILINLGDSFSSLGRPKLALMYYEKAFDFARREKPFFPFLPEIFIGMARTNLMTKNRRKALHHLLKAIEQVELRRAHLVLGRHRSGTTELYLHMYAKTIQVSCDLDQAELAFLTMQMAGSRELAANIAVIQKAAIKEPKDECKSSSSVSVNLPGKPPLCPNAIRLLEHRILLHYFVSENTLFCTVLSKRNGARVRSISIESRRDFRRKIQTLVNDFVGKPPGVKLLENVQQALREMHDILIGPLEDLLRDSDRLVIVPSGELHNVPFACLFDGEKYLVQKHIVSYLPHASLLGLADSTHKCNR